MRAVYEVEPTYCPACKAPWVEPGTMLRGWSSSPCSGGMGHRTWTCVTCRHVEHPQGVELPRMGLSPKID